MRLRFVFPLPAAILLFFTALFCCRSQAAIEIPFELRDGVIWMKVAVPGKGATLDFVLDSGASDSVLDLQVARQLGVRFGAPQSVLGVHTQSVAYRVSDFNATAGGVHLPHSPLAMDLGPVSAACSRKIDGLLGADFFRGRIVEINFSQYKVRLLERGELNTGRCEILPMALRNDAMCVRVSVAGGPSAWMRVDTGCNTALQWVANTSARRPGAASVRSIATDIQLGSQRVAAVKTGVHTKSMFPGEAGLLGIGVLSKFSAVTFDMSGRRLLLAAR
ncbi:retropepsin-like aspartic protease [Verrucomicrobiota bacterium sgz303538]